MVHAAAAAAPAAAAPAADQSNSFPSITHGRSR